MRSRLYLAEGEVPRVLIVDDMPELRTILRAFLTELFPCIIEEAGHGLEGIEKALQFLPHLVICDLNMPIMNGAEFLGFIESCGALSETRVIVLTTEAEEAAELSARSLPIDAGIQKPFHAGNLKLVLDHLLERPPGQVVDPR